MDAVVLKNLTFGYRGSSVPALCGLNLTISGGGFVAVTGATNSGKSTLCYLLSGVIPTFIPGKITGNVYTAGCDNLAASIGEISSGTGLVMQNPFSQLSGIRFTVFEEIGFVLENRGVPASEIKKKVAGILDTLEITDLSERNPATLSGGQVQRVALASVLVAEPEILVLDSPFTQLDPRGAKEMIKMMRRLADSGVTVILTGAESALMAEYADRVIALHRGRAVLDGTPGHVFASPELEAYGIKPPVFTETAREAARQSMWCETEELPVTLEQAAGGFRKWIMQ